MLRPAYIAGVRIAEVGQLAVVPRCRHKLKRPLDGHYYCSICFSLDDAILLCNISFCSWARTSKHVEWYRCRLCSHGIALCIKRKRIAPAWKAGTNEYTRHTRKSRDSLNVEWARLLTDTFGGGGGRFFGPAFDGLVKIFTSKIAQEILTCEAHSLTVSVFELRYATWPLEIILKTWNL
jgi:hypothetical protein